jgi:hypothetical protein
VHLVHYPTCVGTPDLSQFGLEVLWMGRNDFSQPGWFAIQLMNNKTNAAVEWVSRFFASSMFQIRRCASAALKILKRNEGTDTNQRPHFCYINSNYSVDYGTNTAPAIMRDR